jgi:hypothetical protein
MDRLTTTTSPALSPSSAFRAGWFELGEKHHKSIPGVFEPKTFGRDLVGSTLHPSMLETIFP